MTRTPQPWSIANAWDALATRLVETDDDLTTLARQITCSLRATVWSDLVDRILVPPTRSHAHAARVLAGLGS